jgi:Fuc2NAc and GlcNAc transferase
VTLVVALVGLGAFAISFLLTRAVRETALAHGLLDVPNERSSHAVPTPRGGGVAIVVGSICALVALLAVGAISRDLFVAATGGGLAVAVVGLVDDRRPLPARTRLVVHTAAAIWALFWLGGPPGLHVAGPPALVLGVGWVGAVLGIVWVLNLYNFMDGIDGIAASEALFVSWGGALLLAIIGGSPAVAVVSVAFGAACLGFLIWNWPPAKIFMGDVGSGFIGYMVGVITLAAAREVPNMLIVLPLLSGVFLVDATVTLTRRLVSGERVFSAHRSHAYQRLARRWGGHKKVTAAAAAVNLLWLLPWAYAATLHPNVIIWEASIALVPLVVGALAAGAGRRECGSSKA